MQKGPIETSPPYPGPPMNYGGAPPTEMYPQPGFSPAGPPPAGHQGGVPHMIVTPALNDVPGQALCPHCHQTVTTNTEHKPGMMSWAVCCCLGFFGCFLCCCIPFCVDRCRDVEHRCPSCDKVIYLYKRM